MKAIPREEMKRRYDEFLKLIGPDAVAIVPAATWQQRNRDVDYPFRQDSNFFYLSGGFPTPDAVLVLDGKTKRTLFFCTPPTADSERWLGSLIGPDDAKKHFGFDKAYPITKFDKHIEGLVRNRTNLYFPLDNTDWRQRINGWMDTVQQERKSASRQSVSFTLHHIDNPLGDLRMIKSAYELKELRKHINGSAQAHRDLMMRVRPGLSERHISEEALDELFLKYCRTKVRAYPDIVASGKNVLCLHYTEYSGTLNDGDLLLVDAGAECVYASDITRTYPVNGVFTETQRQLYGVVLEAQLAAIAATRPGVHFLVPHFAAVRIIAHGLSRLGILKGSTDDIGAMVEDYISTWKSSSRANIKRREKNPIFRFFMHRTSHWLGLDVHDLGVYRDSFGEHIMLVEGMVLTIEPGIYIPANAADVDEKWRGMGIRIEDVVAVTKDGCEVLSADAPKDPCEIEALMADGDFVRTAVGQ